MTYKVPNAMWSMLHACSTVSLCHSRGRITIHDPQEEETCDTQETLHEEQLYKEYVHKVRFIYIQLHVFTLVDLSQLKCGLSSKVRTTCLPEHCVL